MVGVHYDYSHQNYNRDQENLGQLNYLVTVGQAVYRDNVLIEMR